MSSFTHTSNWKRKGGTTLVYSYEHGGEKHEGSSEMEPKTVAMQLERLSLLNDTSWRVKDENNQDSEAGFFAREFISALGVLDNCRVHAITLDENPNETSSRIQVSIYPAPLEELQATSLVDDWSSFITGEPPQDGWLKDEVGRLGYNSADDYHDASMFSASVRMSQEKFDALCQSIKQGGIRSARLELLADLYHFGYESMGAGIRGHLYNYAILSKDEGTSASGTTRGTRGWTKARMQELTLEWSPKLESTMAGRRDEPDEVDYLELDVEPKDMVPIERNLEKAVAMLSHNVKGIRGRVDAFYLAAIVVAVLWLISQVSDWLGL